MEAPKPGGDLAKSVEAAATEGVHATAEANGEAGVPSDPVDNDGWARWIARAPLIGAAAALVTAVGALLVLFLPNDGERNATGAESLLDGMELVREGNARFGFWFSHPKTWTREDAENSDGNIFTDPRLDATVSVTFSGSFTTIDDPLHLYMEELVGSGDSYVKRILDSRPAGLHLWTYSEDASGEPIESRQQIDGWRMTLLLDGEAEEMTAIYQIAEAEGRHVSFYAVAPTRLFPEYVALFNELAADVRIVSSLDLEP